MIVFIEKELAQMFLKKGEKKNYRKKRNARRIQMTASVITQIKINTNIFFIFMMLQCTPLSDCICFGCGRIWACAHSYLFVVYSYFSLCVYHWFKMNKKNRLFFLQYFQKNVVSLSVLFVCLACFFPQHRRHLRCHRITISASG